MFRELQSIVVKSGALGFWRDRASGSLTIAVPADGSSTLRVEMLDARLEARIVTRSITLAQIASIDARTEKMLLAGQFDGGGFESRFDPESGRVVIGTTATNAFSILEAEFPGLVDIHYGWPRATSRQADIEPHYGGTLIYSEGYTSEEYCTSGFSVNNSSENPRMITAGHCSDLSPIGDWVHPLSGDSFGHVKNRDGYPEHDFEVVGENWIGQKARIYVTDNAYDEDWANVINAWDPSPGTPQYCWSGATTYVNCGFAFVSNPPSRWCPPGDLPGGWLYPVDSYGTHCNYSIAMMCSDETDFGPRGGDSGAPVYKAYSATEVGIRGIVVGADAFGACGYVELLSEILATNPGMTVKTIP